LDTLDGKLRWIKAHFEQGKPVESMSDIGSEIGRNGNPKAIPVVIGIIDADNSYDTIYGLGYFALGFDELGKMTGVRYSAFHDGTGGAVGGRTTRAGSPKKPRIRPFPTCPRRLLARSTSLSLMTWTPLRDELLCCNA